ncbi:hypothetical protein HID58_005575 [Brassica napus]|uniref:Uncharacterized protein n=1 Tax=Brassica napus TaxID=3708 RepID=A0ABQ8E8Y1_BRANA|nr:hypothetical protein HID58_005575 [Brassica napus]
MLSCLFDICFLIIAGSWLLHFQEAREKPSDSLLQLHATIRVWYFGEDMGIFSRSSNSRKSKDGMKIIAAAFFGVTFGFLIGISFPSLSITKVVSSNPFYLSALCALSFYFFLILGRSSSHMFQVNLPTKFLASNDLSYIEEKGSAIATPDSHKSWSSSKSNDTSSSAPIDKSQACFFYTPFRFHLAKDVCVNGPCFHALFLTCEQIWVPSNPRGAERLPPGIVAAESDFYLRRLWGLPHEDLTRQPRYLVTFTVGIKQKQNIDACVKKFSENFTILLFHYDGRVTEWDEFEWSKTAIHISVRKQTKWWYAKRFLHPDIVARYDYIFIWDEDLGVEHFNAEEYIKLVKKHGLEISQPGLEPNKGLTWQMTKRRGDLEVHKITEEKPGWCSDPHLPPCAAFVEIMAPVFSRDAWRCVWHMIQNDLVHGWGLDFALRRCAEPAHEKIGVVDSQWIVHQTVPSLGSQGEAVDGKAPWQGVRDRCKKEWTMFQSRMANAEKAYFKSLQVVGSSNTTATTI